MSTVSSVAGTNIVDLLNKNSASANSTNTDGSTGSSQDTGTAADTKNLDTQYTQFLQLLTKQLQNQDPLNPMDTAQFTQQLVQFSSVEQMINQNKRLDQLINLQSSTNTYAAASFLGKTVAVDSNLLAVKGGSGTFQYKIEHTGDKALLRIADAKGNVVAIQEANSAVGTYQVNWNGKDAVGNQLPDGLYQVSVQYEDTTGKDYSAPITVYGQVDSADVQNGTVSLNIGAGNYTIDQVIQIVQPAASNNSGSGNNNSGSGSNTGTPTTPNQNAA